MADQNKQAQQNLDSWKKMVDEQMARVTSIYDELSKVEGKQIDQLRSGIDEAAKMMKESLAYATQLTAEWRRLSLEATRRAADFMGSKA